MIRLCLGQVALDRDALQEFLALGPGLVNLRVQMGPVRLFLFENTLEHAHVVELVCGYEIGLNRKVQIFDP